MKAYKHYIIVRRPQESETQTGIKLVTNDAAQQVVKATVYSLMRGQLDGIKEGDEIMVERRYAFSIEGDPELYAIKPEYVVATLDK